MTAKDFRTWHATVIAATALADEDQPATTKTARKQGHPRRRSSRSPTTSATPPAIASGSYVDPRVIDLYEDGVTIAAALKRAPKDPAKRQARLERAVLRMLA